MVISHFKIKVITIFQVTFMVERFSEPENSTPRPQKSHAKLQIIPRKRTSKKELRKVKFNRVMSKKVVKRYAKNKQKLRRKLVIDLSKVKAQWLALVINGIHMYMWTQAKRHRKHQQLPSIASKLIFGELTEIACLKSTQWKFNTVCDTWILLY